MKDSKFINLVPPCSYQGGKQRLSNIILDIIEQKEGTDFKFYDLCCGSGAVSLEAIHRGHNVVMIDKGCFGKFWEKVSKNTFDLDIFKEEIKRLPQVDKIQGYLKDLSNKKVDKSILIYHYLLLQSGAFGSKQIWITEDEWKNNTFRSYWLPTEISNRKSPVNPMMPMPDTLYKRVENILKVSENIQGFNIDVFESIEKIKEEREKVVVYIDPPYKNTTGYKENFDIDKLVQTIPKGVAIYVSEGYQMQGNKESWVLAEGRTKGNISGTVKKKPVEEWLNYFI